jgi:predicted O-linked N-acetylglucosamine transferase (SPINDLY family)
MDYFISGKAIEIGAAQSHYSEQLIEFRNAPVYFKSAAGPDGNQPMDLSDLPGICAGSNIYLCPQTLIKIHPDFDRVMADIHQLDPKAHVVFLEGNSPNWSRRLKQRWESVEGLDLNRLHFIPRLDREDFQRFVLAGDVILDPLHFSGGVSTQEILALGQPVVTCPGPMMRSRVTAGFLSACDMHQLIAPSPGAMARIAVETVRDHQKRNALRQAIRGKSFCLFENFEVIEEFGAFFEAAHESHLSGGRLESWNW